MNRVIVSFVLAACVTAVNAEVPSVLAIRNARVVTAAGPMLPKGTVVVRNGLIESVGANAAIPADAWVLDGEGLTVYPGLIDALSGWGIPEAAPSAPTGRGGGGPPAALIATATPVRPTTGEDRQQNMSFQRAADLLRPTDRRLQEARNAGFTTSITFPSGGIIAGQGAAINLAGDKPGQMVLTSTVGLHLSLTSRGFTAFPGSLMGVIAYIRQVYLDAGHYQYAKDAYQRNPRGLRRPEYDRSLEGVLESPRILLPATRAVEIERMLRFAAELKKTAVLYGGHEAYRAADLLKSSATPMLVSLRWPERARDSDPDQVESLRTLELRDKAPSTPAALVKAGVPFAFYSAGIERPVEVIRAVKRALDAGLSREDAVRAMTLSPAEIYGLSDRLGSIEPGKIANLLITDGELFEERTRVKYVLIDGKKFEPAATTPAAEEVTR